MENQENCSKLLEYICENRDVLAKKEAETFMVTLKEAQNQIELAIGMMKGDTKNYNVSSEDRPVCYVTSNVSLFETILDIYSYISVGLQQFYYGSESRSAVTDILSFMGEKSHIEHEAESDDSLLPTFCTMIIFDEADVGSATDVLCGTWNKLGMPWCIRDVLVSEHCLDDFTRLITDKLRSIDVQLFNEKYRGELETVYEKSLSTARNLGLKIIQQEDDNNTLKPCLIFGTTREHLESNPLIQSPVVTVNTFRTPKEAINLCNKSSSLSVWTNDLFIGYEVSYTSPSLIVWMNCHGVFNNKFPFTFRSNDFIYGSELAIIQKTLKRRNLDKKRTVTLVNIDDLMQKT